MLSDSVLKNYPTNAVRPIPVVMAYRYLRRRMVHTMDIVSLVVQP